MSVLSNVENEQRLIYLLCKHVEEKEIRVVNAKSDADALIVETAVKYALNVPTVVVGEDTDLLILSRYHSDQNGNNTYFTSDRKN
ncbi:hypothetical protein DPMN_000947 [Dreissena polymorpha]|uniref:Uncharacterized protein n=1 Tax=Dreissena polymorpha TaxID=45954 RepID=A0A9D4MKI7_DREPO|nr:hypothetical protein DPMN_000947 [Dreissena polymorpha]